MQTRSDHKWPASKTLSLFWQFVPVSQTISEVVAEIRCFLLVSFVFIALGGFTAAKAELVITNLAQIRALTREEAAKAIPVRVHGVVTWQQAQNVAFVVDDGTQAVYVDTTMPKKSGVWIGGNPQMSENEPGAEVVVEGFTDPGGFAPVIACTKFRRIGTGTQFPRHLKLEELISGSADALWVELDLKQANADPDRPGNGFSISFDLVRS